MARAMIHLFLFLGVLFVFNKPIELLYAFCVISLFPLLYSIRIILVAINCKDSANCYHCFELLTVEVLKCEMSSLSFVFIVISAFIFSIFHFD
jgi:hypothetical protein